MLLAALKGFGTGAGLIIAIGAQNAFVLRQGLLRQHRFLVALISALGDAALIVLGVFGLGSIFASSPLLIRIATWGGAAFLIVYGARALRSALRPRALDLEAQPAASRRGIVLSTLAFSLLNPHVYLDTVVLIGSLAAGYGLGGRLGFAGGAVAASFVWFFALAFGASALVPLFRKPAAWRVLDALVGAVMWLLAVSLLVSHR
nr:LysE/ArgO family amino acid transporter [Deinobacterium chartae]